MLTLNKALSQTFKICFFFVCFIGCLSSTVSSLPLLNQCIDFDTIKNKKWCQEAVEIDNVKNYSVIRKTIFDKSSEGGELAIYYDNNVLVKATISSYGEMGYIIKTFHYFKDKSKLYSILDVDYDRPFYVDGFKELNKDIIFIVFNKNAEPVLYKNGELGIFKTNYEISEFDTILKKYSNNNDLSDGKSATEIKKVNQIVNNIEEEVKSKKLETMIIKGDNIIYQFHFNEKNLKRCQISVDYGKYSHFFSFYYDEFGRILKYLKITEADKELIGQLDLSKRAIIYGKNSEVLWKNVSFDPPVDYSDILKLFYYLKKGQRGILSF